MDIDFGFSTNNLCSSLIEIVSVSFILFIRLFFLFSCNDCISSSELVVELITPVALEKGLRFAIREGGRTVGSGTITEIVE